MQFECPALTLAASVAAVFLITVSQFNFSISIASSVVIPLTAIGITESISRAITFPLAEQVQLALIAVIGFCGFASLFLIQSSKVSRHRFRSTYLLIALLTPSLISFLILIKNENIFGANLLWVVQGDAQTNIVSANEIVEINGFTDGIPSLAQGVMALMIAAGHSDKIEPVAFIQMMQIQAGILALCWGVSSVLFGAIALKELQFNNRVINFVVVLVSAGIPLTWGVLGFSIEAGFFNTPLALISLLASWIFWRGLSEKYKFGTISMLFLLITTSIFTFLAWAPLAIIPLIFTATVAVRYLITLATKSTKLFYIIALVSFIVAVYLGIKGYPQLSAIGKIAATSGYMSELSPKLVALSLLMILISGFFWRTKQNSIGSYNFGLILMTSGAIFGLTFLLLQGFSPTGPIDWYYYPRKFAWFLLFVLNFLTLIYWASKYLIVSNLSKWKKATSYALFIMITMLFVMEYPPKSGAQFAVFPFVEVAKNSKENSQIIEEIASAIGTKQVRFGYSGNDFIVNQWTFQWRKFDENKQIWPYAYSQILSVQDVCEVSKDWGGGVTLFTRSKAIINDVQNQCGNFIISIKE